MASTPYNNKRNFLLVNRGLVESVKAVHFSPHSKVTNPFSLNCYILIWLKPDGKRYGCEMRLEANETEGDVKAINMSTEAIVLE